MTDADSNSVWTSCAVNVPVTVTSLKVGESEVPTPCAEPLPFKVFMEARLAAILVAVDELTLVIEPLISVAI